jgi:hypothetical protein
MRAVQKAALFTIINMIYAPTFGDQSTVAPPSAQGGNVIYSYTRMIPKNHGNEAHTSTFLTAATLPMASSTVLGGVKISGNNLSIDPATGIMSATGGGVPSAHNLVDSTNHPIAVSGAGLFLKSLSTTTYGFAAHGLTASDVGAQAVLTNPITGTGTYNQIAVFTGTSALEGTSGLTWDGIDLKPNGNVRAYGDVLAYSSGSSPVDWWDALPSELEGIIGTGLSMTGGILNADITGIGVTDGDKGDITVSSSGTVWTIDNPFPGLGTGATNAAHGNHNHSGVYLTSETSHADVLVDGDIGVNVLAYRTFGTGANATIADYATLASPTFTGTATFTRGAGVASIKAASDNGGHLILDSYSGGDVYLNNYNNGNVLLGTGGGYVGIGTTAPLVKTELMGSLSTSTPENILMLSRNYNAGTVYASTASFALSNQYPNNTRLDIKLLNGNTGSDTVPDTIVMSLLSGGNIGLGTTAPSQVLHVVGNGLFTGDVICYG